MFTQIHIVIHNGWPEAGFFDEAEARAYVETEVKAETDRAEKSGRPAKQIPYYVFELEVR